jgi:hypothetical protein
MFNSSICKFKIRSLKPNHPWWGSVNSFCEWEGGVTVSFLMRFQRTFQISNLNLEISNYKYEYENMNSLIIKKWNILLWKHTNTIQQFWNLKDQNFASGFQNKKMIFFWSRDAIEHLFDLDAIYPFTLSVQMRHFLEC